MTNVVSSSIGNPRRAAVFEHNAPLSGGKAGFLVISWTSHALLNLVGNTEYAMGFSRSYGGHFTPLVSGRVQKYVELSSNIPLTLLV